MNHTREFFGARTGFAVLASATVFIVSWLWLQGDRQAAQRLDKPVLPPLESTADLNRFRADALNLPNEPLLGFVEIPAGKFIIGSDPTIDDQAYANERWSPNSYQGHIDLSSFYVGRFEVTVAQFRAFVDDTGYKADVAALRAPATQPVTSVAWTDAIAYAAWLDSALRKLPALPPTLKQLLDAGWHVSLPSEAQWEKSARSIDGRIYPWGNFPSRERANFRSEAVKPVGSIPCSECANGLSDMSGNVWEFTRSRFQPYPFDASDDTPNLQADALFVMRGGSFTDTEGNVRTAVRGGIDPGARRPNIGFRVVLVKL